VLPPQEVALVTQRLNLPLLFTQQVLLLTHYPALTLHLRLQITPLRPHTVHLVIKDALRTGKAQVEEIKSGLGEFLNKKGI
jgi:hypothetical protein